MSSSMSSSVGTSIDSSTDTLVHSSIDSSIDSLVDMSIDTRLVWKHLIQSQLPTWTQCIMGVDLSFGSVEDGNKRKREEKEVI